MILDIYKDGCTIWTDRNVTSIKGTPEEICHQIYMRSVVLREEHSESKLDQIYDIGIDMSSHYGHFYREALNNMGLKTYDICSKHIDVILPIRVTYDWGKPERICDDIERFRRR